MNELSKKIEAILFYKSEEMSFKELSKLLLVEENEIILELENLKEKYQDSGMKFVLTDSSVAMVTSEIASGIIEKMEQEEYDKDLTKAALETLTIILYRGPIKRSMIDFIRGVNSSFTLRNLLVRGLIEKVPDPKDDRTYFYKPTLDLLRYLSISDIKELQEYKDINQKIDSFITNSASNE